MRLTTLGELTTKHDAMMRSDDPPVQVVVHPDNLSVLLRAPEADEYRFKRNEAGDYLAFGLPVILDHECPGAVVMNAYQTRLWEEHQAANIPFGSLSLR